MTKPINTDYIRTVVIQPYNFSWSDNIINILCDEIDRLRGEQQTPQGQTVAVEVDIEVTPGGWWNLHTSGDNIMPGSKLYTLSANLLVPVIEECLVEAEVKDGEC